MAEASIIDELMAELAIARPVFHSEADFQHAFALALMRRDPLARVRLEYRPWPTERISLDVWAVVHDVMLALELKYLTRSLTTDLEGERFTLLNHGAHDTRRYDVWADVVRLERLAAHHAGLQVYAVCLTNDPAYWKGARGPGTIDEDFRIHEGRSAAGTLSWGPAAGPGTTKGRTAPLVLMGNYQLAWRDYAAIGGQQLRYLTLPAPPRPLPLLPASPR